MKNKMYTVPTFKRTGLNINASYVDNTIEEKIEKMVRGGESMGDKKAPLVYNERKEGVRASMNIRTDRMEIAINATDKIAKSYQARREEKPVMKVVKGGKDGETESPQGTGTDDNK